MTVDALDLRITANVEAAKAAMLGVAKSDPRRSWTAYELKKVARNGWSGSTMGLALFALLDDGGLLVGEDRLLTVPQ